VLVSAVGVVLVAGGATRYLGVLRLISRVAAEVALALPVAAPLPLPLPRRRRQVGNGACPAWGGLASGWPGSRTLPCGPFSACGAVRPLGARLLAAVRFCC
jgi:hypothetical protein